MKANVPHPIAAKIRDRRKQCRLSVRQAAEMTGVSHSWLDKQERGVAKASPLRLETVWARLTAMTATESDDVREEPQNAKRGHSAKISMRLTDAAGRVHRIGQMAPCLLILHVGAEPGIVALGAGQVELIVDDAIEIIPVHVTAQESSLLRIASED